MLYGLRLTFQDIGHVGVAGVLMDVLVVASTFGLACWLGMRVFKMEREAAMLIGATAICGAAAVMAAEPVVRAALRRSPSRSLRWWCSARWRCSFTRRCMHWCSRTAGWQWTRGSTACSPATVHEVAQVVAAGRAVNSGADTAVITKMVRVMLLAPFLVALSLWLARGGKASADGSKARIVVPWFAFGFVAVAGFNSLHLLPGLQAGLVQLDTVLLAMAMAALGLTTTSRRCARPG